VNNLTAAVVGFAVCMTVGMIATAVFRTQGTVRQNLLPGIVTSAIVAGYIYLVR
jgi:predicted transcriptional regulator